MWRRRFFFELYKEFQEPDKVETIKVNRLRWVGYVERMKETEPSKYIYSYKMTTKRNTEDQKRYIMKILEIKKWRVVASNRIEWNRIVERAKTHSRLSNVYQKLDQTTPRTKVAISRLKISIAH